jgi:tellurite methyltransferase
MSEQERGLPPCAEQEPVRHPDAERWDNRYEIEGPSRVNSLPNALLRRYADLLPASGLALDAACGVANHGLFLAERGLRVIGLDISLVGLRFAQQQAKERGLRLSLALWDLSQPWLPPDAFDVITNFRYLERTAFPVFRQALKPGGLLFFATFMSVEPHDDHPEYYLRPGELLETFGDYEIIHHSLLPEMRHTLEQLVARKLSS